MKAVPRGGTGHGGWVTGLAGGFIRRSIDAATDGLADHSLGSPSGSTSAASYFFAASWVLVALNSQSGIHVLPSLENSLFSVKL
jgi:hypothetical protein